jgi:hypothetical protein
MASYSLARFLDRYDIRLKPTKGGRYLGKRTEWDKDKDLHKCIIELHSRPKGQSDASKFVEQFIDKKLTVGKELDP